MIGGVAILTCSAARRHPSIGVDRLDHQAPAQSQFHIICLCATFSLFIKLLPAGSDTNVYTNPTIEGADKSLSSGVQSRFGTTTSGAPPAPPTTHRQSIAPATQRH